jgi:hypothetical protein
MVRYCNSFLSTLKFKEEFSFEEFLPGTTFDCLSFVQNQILPPDSLEVTHILNNLYMKRRVIINFDLQYLTTQVILRRNVSLCRLGSALYLATYQLITCN